MARPKGSMNKQPDSMIIMDPATPVESVSPLVPPTATRNVPQSANIAQVYSPFEKKLDTAIELLTRVVDKLDRQFEGRISSRTLETKEEVRKVEKQTTWSSHVPQDFRDIVDDMLSKEFGIQVIPMSDSPSFQFLLTVPEKYSTISKEHKEMFHADVRARVINNGDGPAGVRAYVEKIWSSFNPTIQAQIVNDRKP